MICHKNLSLLCFYLLKGDKKTVSLVQKIFFGPIRMFSCPPSINKNKEVTKFCDKSCHLFLWQTNRTCLIWPAKIKVSLTTFKGRYDRQKSNFFLIIFFQRTIWQVKIKVSSITSFKIWGKKVYYFFGRKYYFFQ